MRSTRRPIGTRPSFCSQGAERRSGDSRRIAGAERRGEPKRLTAAAGPRADARSLRDLPNLCSLAALLAAVLGIYFAIRGTYPAAMIALLWAVVLDWSDGRLARAVKERTPISAPWAHSSTHWSMSSASASHRRCSSCASGTSAPGSYRAPLWSFLRESSGSATSTCSVCSIPPIEGCPSTTTSTCWRFSSSSSRSSPRRSSRVVLYVALMVLAALNVASIATPKLGGRWYYLVVGYALVLSGVFARQLA